MPITMRFTRKPSKTNSTHHVGLRAGVLSGSSYL